MMPPNAENQFMRVPQDKYMQVVGEPINLTKLKTHSVICIANGLFPNEQNFGLDNSRQNVHYSLKEHHKISNIPKFRCEML